MVRFPKKYLTLVLYLMTVLSSAQALPDVEFDIVQDTTITSNSMISQTEINTSNTTTNNLESEINTPNIITTNSETRINSNDLTIISEVENSTNTDTITEKLDTVKIINNKDLLEGESSLMLNEFQNIMALYNSSPSGISQKVILYRKLLARLNKMEVNTEFLTGQRDLMKSALRYRLGITNRAEQGIQQLVMTSQIPSIREDAAKMFISFAYAERDKQKIDTFIKTNTSFLSSEMNAYGEIVAESLKKNNSAEESDYLLENIVLAPQSSFENNRFNNRLLNNIQDNLSEESLKTSINFLLYNERLDTALFLMRVVIKTHSVDYDTLLSWGQKLGRYERDLLDSIKMYQSRSDSYKQYVVFHQDRLVAKSRGRQYHRKLYSYRGEGGAPYNVPRAESLINEYLSGAVEPEYLEKNAERSFRNFLAYKNYDTLINTSRQMREKMGSNSISPYINFWESYALLKQGNTNDAIPLLGAILAVAPESYYGILAQKKLRYVFSAIPFTSNKYFSELKKQSDFDKSSLLAYAHVLYYMGNRSSKWQAEKIFLQEGLIFPDVKTSLNSSKEFLINAHLELGLINNVRQLAYHGGIKSVYGQDVLLSKYYQKIDNISALMNLVEQRSTIFPKRNSYVVGKDALRIYFPTPYQEHFVDAFEKSDKKMDAYLLYSVMRTESFYKEKAKSSAGARGLMQIMPVTGQWLVDKYLPKMQNYSLYTPSINIYLGSVYMYDNIQRMGFLPAIAAYNSGPTFVRNLVKQYQPHTDLELMEIHPKQETRNYVKKVVESYTRYSYIYNNDAIQLYAAAS